MSLLLRSTAVVMALALAALAQAQDQIPWAANLEQAQRAAADERKLLLLHFYNDHCPPCERLEQTVFNQPHVAQAIGRNFIPVKIHAGLQPRVAEHYQVNRWPTDVICTAAGQEIHRTTSPRTASEYVTFCDSQAMQAGVGATRQWATSMQAAGQQVAVYGQAQGQNALNQANATGQGYLTQANTAAQGLSQQANQQFAATGQEWNQAAQQAHGTASNWGRQVTDTSRQLTDAAQQIGATAGNTARDLRSQWDATNLRAPAPLGPAAGAGPGIAAGSAPPRSAPPGIYQPAPQAQIAAQPPQQPALPTSNPWIGHGAAAQVTTQPPPAASATTQPAWQPSGASPGAGPELSPYAAALQPQQPAGPRLIPASQAPPVALEGYCPVTLLEGRQWQKADERFGAIHRGRTYLFRSAAEQTKFLADPDRYSPVLSGYDPVVFAQRGEMVEGKRSYGLTYNKQIFLFADEASIKAFETAPQAYAGAAYQAMQRAETSLKYR